MMQVVPKWKVSVFFVGTAADVAFWVFANSIGDVLRQVASMSFTENGLEQPTSIQITQSQPVSSQQGITTSVAQGGVRVGSVSHT